MMTATGIRKKRWPITSIQSRTRLGSVLFTMSMRMCSLERSVQAEHRRNTHPKRTHCNSSHELEDVLKTFRTVALTALTRMAARTPHAMIWPRRVLNLSTTRLNPSNPFTCFLRANSSLFDRRLFQVVLGIALFVGHTKGSS